jgi:hypothetical protein
LLTGVARAAEQGSSALVTAPRRGIADEGAELGFLCRCGGLSSLVSAPRRLAPADVAGVVRGGSPAGTGHGGKARCGGRWIYPTARRCPRVPLRGGLQPDRAEAQVGLRERGGLDGPGHCWKEGKGKALCPFRKNEHPKEKGKKRKRGI